MKKYLAEMIGTMVLVLMGCGSAVFAGSAAGRLVQVSERWEWLLLSACPLWRWHTLSEESRAVILILPLPWVFCCPAG